MKIKYLILLVTLCLLFWYCQKKLFGYVEVHGRLLYFFSEEPVITRQVTLWTDDATSAKNSTEHSILLATGFTGSDGSFSLRSKPSRRAAYYFSSEGSGRMEKLNIRINQKNDLGTIYVGRHSFNCKINLVPVSDSCIAISPPNGGNYTVYSAGTTTSCVQTFMYSHADYEAAKHQLVVNYRKSKNCSSTNFNDYRNYTLYVPITTADTMTVNLSY